MCSWKAVGQVEGGSVWHLITPFTESHLCGEHVCPALPEHALPGHAQIQPPRAPAETALTSGKRAVPVFSRHLLPSTVAVFVLNFSCI